MVGVKQGDGAVPLAAEFRAVVESILRERRLGARTAPRSLQIAW